MKGYSHMNYAERDEQPERDWEALLGGRWLLLAGILLVFLGTGFFLKVAFDHNWIVPAARVWLGILVGVGLIAYAQRFAWKDRRFFAEGITALGGAMEFLSLYSANALFHLAPPAAVLAGMVVINAAIAGIACFRRSERLGVLATLGGYMAPVLAGATDDVWMLGAYLAVLNAGMLALGGFLSSRIIAPLVAVGTLVYAVANITSAQIDDIQRAAIYAALYAPFALNGWILAWRGGRTEPVQTIVNGVALVGLAGGLESALFPAHRMLLAEALAGVTALHLGAAIAFKSRYQSWFSAFAAILAVPAASDGAALQVGWAVESAILAIAGLRMKDQPLWIAGLGLFGLDVIRDFIRYTDYVAPRPFLNGRSAACAAAFSAASAIAYYAHRFESQDDTVVSVLRVCAHAIALLGLSTEAWSSVQYYGGTQQAASAALSLVGAAFGGTLIAAGLRKHDAMLRWEGLVLVTLAAAKVLVLDLSFLDLAYRVISAILVGVVLIGVSYVYQRRAAAK
jgi:uncharacterized membrane protein